MSKEARQKKATKKLVSARLTQRDLENAAAYFRLRDPGDRSKFLPVDQLRSGEIEREIEEIRKKLDQESTPQENELALAFFRTAARLWRRHLMSQNSGSEAA